MPLRAPADRAKPFLSPVSQPAIWAQFCWEADYDHWIKREIDRRNFDSTTNYGSSHALGKLAAPIPDHFVPALYSLALMKGQDEVRHFYEGAAKLPSFSERSFMP